MKANATLTFTELTKLSPEVLFEHAKGTVKQFKSINSAREKFTGNLKFHAMVVAAMKRRYTEMVNTKGIPADTAFKKYFEQHAGGVCPPRVEALASLFNALVETNLLKEEHFNGAAVDWLERANAIVSAARKTHGDQWKGCDDVKDVVNALSTPGDALTALKEIRKRQKDAETPKATGEPTANETVPLTLEVAVAFVKAQFSAAGSATRARQLELCVALFDINDAWTENDLSETRRNELDQQITTAKENGVAPGIEVITEKTKEKGEAMAKAA